MGALHSPQNTKLVIMHISKTAGIQQFSFSRLYITPSIASLPIGPIM